MSLRGPGCVYVPHELEMQQKRKPYEEDGTDYNIQLNRSALNGIDIEDSTIANNIIMPNGLEDTLSITAKEGEAVLLMGRCWEGQNLNLDNEKVEEDSGSTCTSVRCGCKEARNDIVLAVPHRSPNLRPDEMRILLTVDVVPIEPKYRKGLTLG
mmetsp:Transcript_2863/g.3427  ORF Transcript_2863/g.3427 Transcript_2863/m.3427 type:complete len:154 (+) Transcript_2863:280-741(+)